MRFWLVLGFFSGELGEGGCVWVSDGWKLVDNVFEERCAENSEPRRL